MLHPSARARGFRLHHHASVGSTNAEALARGRAGDPGRLWVLADRQSAGRGRVGRHWHSPAGNHHASLLLVDPCPQRLAPQLAFVAGVAVARALISIVGEGHGIALKWPNDVLCGNAKLAGLLVEGMAGPRIGEDAPASPGFSAVLGFGINCASHPSHLAYPTTHLALLAGPAGTRDAVFAALSVAVVDTLDIWDRGRNFAGIRRAWLDCALPPGTSLAVALPGATPVGSATLTGTFETVDDDGRLILKTSSGCVTVEAGDVFLADREVASASLC